MKIIYIAVLLSAAISQPAFSQNKGDNTISVKGVGFIQVCNALLDFGYSIKKKDIDLHTVETDFKNGTGKAELFKCRLLIRVKDSTAFITGHNYNVLINAMEYTRNTKSSKLPFDEMNKFALSLGGQVEYLKQSN